MNLGRIIGYVPSGLDSSTSLLAVIIGMFGSFAFAGPTTDFVVAPVNSLVVDLTPGIVTMIAIQLLGKLSEILAFGFATAVTGLLFWAAALVGIRTGRRTGDWFGVPLGVYFAAWTIAALLTRSPFPSLAAAIPMAITAGVLEYRHRNGQAKPEPTFGSRRRVLKTIGGLLGIGGLSAVLGLRRGAVEQSSLSAIPARERRTIERRLQDARQRSLDVDGIPGLVSSIDEFYEVDINTINPDVTTTDWQLMITGAVKEEQTVTYGDLTAMRPDHRFVTLRCVGEPLNGELMDTALWTGVPVAPLLQRSKPQGTHVMLRAVDGYHEEFPLDALTDGFLAYGMNGRALPRNHGYPVRALVPGHWGEINVKWLTEIEVLDRGKKGYWEKRGWHGTGPVNTVAKLWTVNRLSDGRLQVGGHAYAGTRGIRTVGVSTDGGEHWEEATLGPRLPGTDVWRQWKYEWRPAADEVAVVVRAIDGLGNLQPREKSQPYPSGATGWVRKSIRPGRE